MLDRCKTGMVVAALAVAATAAAGSAQAADPGMYPTNWKGQWLHTINRAIEVQGTFDQTKAWGPGQQAPLTPEYQKVLQDSMADQAKGGLGNYPTATCRPSGMPRMMTFGAQEYVVTPETTYILLNSVDHIRRIFTDGRDWPTHPTLTYGGYTIGRWVDGHGSGHYDTLMSLVPGSRRVQLGHACGAVICPWDVPDPAASDAGSADGRRRAGTLDDALRQRRERHPDHTPEQGLRDDRVEPEPVEDVRVEAGRRLAPDDDRDRRIEDAEGEACPGQRRCALRPRRYERRLRSDRIEVAQDQRRLGQPDALIRDEGGDPPGRVRAQELGLVRPGIHERDLDPVRQPLLGKRHADHAHEG